MWLDLTRRQNLLNVLARHREAYHEPLAPSLPSPSHDSSPPEPGAPSIHDLEGELTEIPPIDIEPRGLFVDRIIAADASR